MSSGKVSFNQPHMIVLGNEKGGSGKSTTAMHIVVTLLNEGYRVGVIDLDARQKTIASYIKNREDYCKKNNFDLPMPIVKVLPSSDNKDRDTAQEDELTRFLQTIEDLADITDVIVIDCPGNDTHLARLAHAGADTLVTPVNDSFVDIDLLAKVNPENHEIEGISLYSEMVWEARKLRASTDRSTVDWVVLRNRLGNLNAHNKQAVEKVLSKLSKRVGFRYISGLGERVIYRELFLKGLTLMDLKDVGGIDGKGLTMSHVAARQELRLLMNSLDLPFRKKEKAEAAE
mgnify:CR=1 FL=1